MSLLSDVGSIASIVAAVGIVGGVVRWLWRWSRRRAFPDLSIEVMGTGFVTVEHVTTVVGASSSLAQAVKLHRFQVNIISREPDRNSALTVTLRFRGPDGDEVIWGPPHWRITAEDVDERLDLLTPPINVEREHTVAGVLLFEPGLLPIDQSVPPRLAIYDHVSRSRVRIPAQIANYDKRTWEPEHPGGRVRRWWQRQLEREERSRAGY